MKATVFLRRIAPATGVPSLALFAAGPVWAGGEKDGIGYYCEDWRSDDWGILCFSATREDKMHPVFTNDKCVLIPTDWTEGIIARNHTE